MAHQHECRFCEDLFICPKAADECFDEFIICDDCGGGGWRFLWISAVAFLVVSLTLVLLNLLGIIR